MKKTSRFTTTALLALAAIALPACGNGFVLTGLIPVGIVATADRYATGPTVTFDNRSETDLRITYWVGQIDNTSPTGASEWRSPWSNNLILRAGEKDTRYVGHDFFDASTSDSIVRVRVEPAAPGEADGPAPRASQYASDQPYWFEFQAPAPYRVRAFGPADLLTFESFGDGALLPVPEAERFPYRNGDVPSFTDPRATP